MICQPHQLACAAIKQHMAQTASDELSKLNTYTSKLDQIPQVSKLYEILTLDSELNQMLSSEVETLMSWLNSDSLFAIDATKPYVEKLSDIVGKYKNLMPGRYSLADEMVAIVVLADLKHFTSIHSNTSNAVLPSISQESKTKIEAVIQEISPRLNGYLSGIKSLIEMIEAPTS